MTFRIDQAEPVNAPGVPENYPDAKKLVTEDCIKPSQPERNVVGSR